MAKMLTTSAPRSAVLVQASTLAMRGSKFLNRGDENVFEGLFQPMHLLVILGIALFVFGPKKLPELGKGIGEGIRSFKLGLKDDHVATVAESHSGDSAKAV
jgi:sec-independent protein translocase protein TatA